METSLTWLGRLVESPSGADWQRLLDVYSPLLSGWLIRAGVAASDRDDLMQEVLVVVARRVHEFEHAHAGAFRGWLRSILANHLKKYCRERAARPCEFQLDDLTDPHSGLSQRLDREHDEYLARRMLQIVEQDFSSETWSAFRRQALEGQRPKEVARELGLSLNAVIKAKSRVLKRLRQELERLLDDAGSEIRG